MPRFQRVVAVGSPHHVTQRGNGRQDVFLSDELRRVYLELAAEHAAQNGLRVLAYCLMTNHVDLVAIPESQRSLANTFLNIRRWRMNGMWNFARPKGWPQLVHRARGAGSPARGGRFNHPTMIPSNSSTL
jgi:putative transposase